MEIVQEEGLVVDLHAMDDITVSLSKILLRLDSIDEGQRQLHLKLDNLFTAPLLSTDIVANDDLFAGHRKGPYTRLTENTNTLHDVDDDDDGRHTTKCTHLCRLIDDWWLLCCG